MVIELINQAKELNKSDIIDPWETSPFKDLLKLTIDTRGKIGEQIISQSLHADSNNIFNEDISDINKHENDKHYDLKVNDLSIEVKTAYRDSNDSWQHENIYQTNGSDIIVFVDFDYTQFYITIVSTNDIPFKDIRDNTIMFGRKHTTLRKGKEDGHKFDFSQHTIDTLITAGACQTFSSDATPSEIAKFYERRMKNYVGIIPKS